MVQSVAALGAPAQGRGVGRLAATDWDGDGRDELAVLWLGPNGTSPRRDGGGGDR